MTERIEREQALDETRQRQNAIIEASPAAIVVVDTDGKIQLWNEAAEDVFGYGAEAVIGESIRSLGLHSDGTLFRRYLSKGTEILTYSLGKLKRKTLMWVLQSHRSLIG